MAKTNDRAVWQSRRPFSRLSHAMRNAAGRKNERASRGLFWVKLVPPRQVSQTTAHAPKAEVQALSPHVAEVAGSGPPTHGIDWSRVANRCAAQRRNAASHLSSSARASSRASAEVWGNSSFHANGLHASMIIFECEVSPR